MQLRHVMKGVYSVVPQALCGLFTERDLEWRVCGSPLIDVELLRRHTEYNLLSPDAPVVEHFWRYD